MPAIVQIAGRWARLENGDLVTPIPSFAECEHDHATFDGLIARFHKDPAAALSRNVHQIIRARHTGNDNSHWSASWGNGC